MSHFYYNQPHSSLNPTSAFPAPAMPHNNTHGGRGRRSGRLSNQNAHKNFKQLRQPKESAADIQIANFRRDFEAARSFDLEDDEMFCPMHLLTEDDLQSLHSASSDRSSSSSGSPESSPLPQQLQPTAHNGFPTFQPSHVHASSFQHSAATGHLKLHQPLAQRARNAIPIVDPNGRHISPPNSISPAKQMQPKTQYVGRRW